MVTLWLTDAAGPGAAEEFLEEVRPGAFPIPRHFARLECIVRGVDFWKTIDRLLRSVRAPADTYGNSLRNQVALTILSSCRFWELAPILSVANDSFWFEEVRIAEIGYYTAQVPPQVPPVELPLLLRKDKDRIQSLSSPWTPQELLLITVLNWVDVCGAVGAPLLLGASPPDPPSTPL